MKTNIYHITQFGDNSVCLNFIGCRWKCRGCVRSLRWDSHLSPSDVKKLDKICKSKSDLKLEIGDLVRILKDSNAGKLYFGGEEPTLDPNIVEILKILKNEGFWIKLITKGEFLNEKIIGLVDEATLRIKALDDEVHKAYAGVSNKKILENFEKFHDCGKIEVESTYIPGVVECEEILRIARYVAGYDNNMRYRVDKFRSCGGYKKNATNEEVEGCLKKVKKILPNAYTFLSTGKKGYSARCLYPKIG